MLKDVEISNRAFENYNLNGENLDDEILSMVFDMFQKNKENINELLKNENLAFEDLYSYFEKARDMESFYKKDIFHKVFPNGFALGDYFSPVGSVLFDVYDYKANGLDSKLYYEKLINLLVSTIKNKNSLTITDFEYGEQNLKSLIIEFFKDALREYDIDDNLITVLPIEETISDYYDRVYELSDNKITVHDKKSKYNTVIYLEDMFFENNVRNEVKMLKGIEKDYKIINGDMNNIIDYINIYNPENAIIYTKDGNKAYFFINAVTSNNVFWNSSVENSLLDVLELSKDNIDKTVAYTFKDSIGEIEDLKLKRIVYPHK